MPIELNDLKESNEFLKLIFENINSTILIADVNMRIHQFNKSFLSMFDNAADRIIESSFGQEEKQLNAGDRLILYTDGLIENFGTDGEREGKDRFHAFMENSHHLQTQDLVDRAFEDANRQRGGSVPSDDMSLIAVEYTKR